jgi:hypothetical protein
LPAAGTVIEIYSSAQIKVHIRRRIVAVSVLGSVAVGRSPGRRAVFPWRLSLWVFLIYWMVSNDYPMMMGPVDNKQKSKSKHPN